jgi:Phage integrase, N-terminal SAM-like domain
MSSVSAGWRGGRVEAWLAAYEKTLYSSLSRFTGHVQLKGRAARTLESYLCIVRQLGEWARRDPAELEEEQVREFFLFLLRERGYASQSMRQARAALSAFYVEMPCTTAALKSTRPFIRSGIPMPRICCSGSNSRGCLK